MKKICSKVEHDEGTVECSYCKEIEEQLSLKKNNTKGDEKHDI